MSFAFRAFFVLAVERLLYFWVFNFPGTFIAPLQFAVVGYDLIERSFLKMAPIPVVVVGFTLVIAGQMLNTATYDALGGKGVYYGDRLGYDVVPRTGFPFNVGLTHPQYCGVLMTVWGIYLPVAPTLNIFSSTYEIPWVMTAWYLASMHLLEHSRGILKLRSFLGLAQEKVKVK